MTFKEKIRIYGRAMWFEIKEWGIDFLLFLWPVWLLTGVLAICIKFWMWVMF